MISFHGHFSLYVSPSIYLHLSRLSLLFLFQSIFLSSTLSLYFTLSYSITYYFIHTLSLPLPRTVIIEKKGLRIINRIF